MPAKHLGIWLVVAGIFTLGLGRGFAAQADLMMRSEALQHSPAGEVSLSGTVEQVLTSTDTTSRFILTAGATKALVEAPFGTTVAVGEALTVTGRVGQVGSAANFDYARYLARQNVSRVVRAAVLEPAVGAPASLLTFIKSLRQYLSQSLTGSLPPQEGHLASGMVLGSQGVDDPALLQAMNRTGTRHIVAVSGFNIALVGAFFMAAAFAFGLSRRWATLGGVVTLTLYVLITGLSPSAVRAGIMGAITLLALNQGQPTQAFNSLLLAAAAMLALDPLLFEDVSFQLSFAAVLGIITFQPALRRLIPKAVPSVLRDFAALSLAVQIMVAPLGAFHFGSVAFLSIFFNLLIVPLVPLITILGLLLGLFGLIWGPLSMALALPVAMLTHLGLVIIEWGATLPSTFTIEPGSWPTLISAYLILAGIGWWWLNSQRRQRMVRHKFA